MPPPRTVFIPTSEFKELKNKVFIPSSSGTAAGPVPAIPVAASPPSRISPTAAGLVAPVSGKQPAASNPVFHQERNGPVLENMMSISAMPGFRHISIEELRVADYKLDRQLKAGEDLGTDRLQALRLDNSQGGATREKEGLFGILVPPVAAGPSNKATGSPPAVPSGQRIPSPPFFKGTEAGGPGIAGSMGGTASTHVEGRKSTSPSSSNSGFGGFNGALFKVPDGNVPLVPPVLGAGTGKSKLSNQAGAAVVPPTPVPASTANSAPQALNAPRPSVLWSHTDASHITFLLSPAAEVSFTVADAEKEWAYALRQAHETKVQLTKAQAAYDQAVATERLKFKAYSEARIKSDE
ncbi:hypothetical protein FRC04_008530 [Tulasnella sp. 424]|nr:hypothetical protein FRC04_008530 [Tulasnella sp. 424]KAG8974002.1 hypothetical protein FRC05_007918 [Tulasnella sp. 425]